MWPFSSKTDLVNQLVEISQNQEPKFVAEPPGPCKECGVLVTPSKLEESIGMYVVLGKTSITDITFNRSLYCSRCVPEAQLSLHLTNDKGGIDETRRFTFVEGWIQDLDSEGKEQYLVSGDIYTGITCEWCGEPTDSIYTYEGTRYCNDHRTKKSRGG